MEGDIGIPTIDIKPLLKASASSYTAEDRSATVSRLLRACESHGLFFVTGHGISAAQRRLAFDNARRFFSLPEATKRDIPAKKGGFTRGYIGFGGESGSDRLECKEAFSYGYPWPEERPPDNSFQGANIWPESDELGNSWRDDMVDLFRSMVSVNEAVSTGLSLFLDLGLEDLPDLCREGDTISLFRVFHYFPYCNDGDIDGHGGDRSDCGGDCGEGVPSTADVDSSGSDREVGGGRSGETPPTSSLTSKAPRKEKIGSSPHTDWGLSTSILQDGAGGLQFLEQSTQRWVDVPCAAEDALVFNCGDYLSLLTKGRLKSPVHQVVTTGIERTSFVFFFYPSFDATLPVDRAAASSVVATPASTSTSDGPAGNGGGGTGAACGTDPSGESVEANNVLDERGQPERTRVGYNTLLDLAGEGNGASDMSFGQYITKKWGDVFRE